MNPPSVATRRLASTVSIVAAACMGVAALSTWVSARFVGNTYLSRHETFVSTYDVLQLRGVPTPPWSGAWSIAIPIVAIGSMGTLLVAGGAAARSHRRWLPLATLSAACSMLITLLVTRFTFDGHARMVTNQHLVGWEVSLSLGNALVVASVGACLGIGSLLLLEAGAISSRMRGWLVPRRRASVSEPAPGSPTIVTHPS